MLIVDVLPARAVSSERLKSQRGNSVWSVINVLLSTAVQLAGAGGEGLMGWLVYREFTRARGWPGCSLLSLLISDRVGLRDQTACTGA